jgi:hypothetical protein
MEAKEILIANQTIIIELLQKVVVEGGSYAYQVQYI